MENIIFGIFPIFHDWHFENGPGEGMWAKSIVLNIIMCHKVQVKC